MSYIPDCRTDENYNEKYLNAKNKEFLAGYDCAVEQITTLFSNLDAYPDLEELLDDHKAVIKDGKADIAQEAIEEWMESQRDELITSMIDNMSEKEYGAIKEKVDGHSKKKN